MRAARGFGSRRALASERRSIASPRRSEPDLQTQLEELLNEVWCQERFERTHPFTCGVMRERRGPGADAGQIAI
jgi:hypothetical protein